MTPSGKPRLPPRRYGRPALCGLPVRRVPPAKTHCRDRHRRPGWKAAASTRGFLLSSLQRHPRDERGACARPVLDLEAAAMLLHDLLHRRQPETGAEILGCEQRLKDLFEM